MHIDEMVSLHKKRTCNECEEFEKLLKRWLLSMRGKVECIEERFSILPLCQLNANTKIRFSLPCSKTRSGCWNCTMQ